MDVDPNRLLPLDEALANPDRKLFQAKDGTSISFHLQAAEDEKGLVTAIKKTVKAHGGQYIKHFVNMNAYSVLLVTDKGFKKNVLRPSVSVTFIGDSIFAKCLQDVNSYIHPWDDVSKWKKINLFDVIYHRRFQFDKAKRRSKLPCPSEIEQLEPEGTEDCQEIVNDPEQIDITDRVEESNNAVNGTRGDEELDRDDQISTHSFKDFVPKFEEDQRRRGRGYQDRYRDREKVAILLWLVNNKKFANLRGDSVWREMEMKNVCPERPWQSMKNHFLKHLLPRLDSYSFLTECQKRKFRDPRSADDSSDDGSLFYFASIKRQLSKKRNLQ